MSYKTSSRAPRVRSRGRALSGADVLVARRAYSDLQGSPQVLIARQGYGGVGGLLDDIVGGVKKVGSAGYDLLTGTAKAQGEAAAYQQMAQQNAGGIPGWVLPVTLGGVGLFAAVLLLLRRRSEGKKR